MDGVCTEARATDVTDARTSWLVRNMVVMVLVVVAVEIAVEWFRLVE